MKTTMEWRIAVRLLAVLVAATPALGAELTPSESESLVVPLERSDPRAQADPTLESVPNAPVPQEGGKKMSARRSKRSVGHDLTTGHTRLERSARSKSNADEAVSRDEVGAAAQDESAPMPDVVRGASGSAFDPSVIWGTDDRIRITPTTSYPWRAQTKLFSTFPNNARYGCSGTLIAPKYVLTAGHCVQRLGDGGWATRVEVIPGYDNGYRPYGSAYATYLRSVTGWTVSANPQHDFALITLDRAIGNTVGWFGYGSFSNTTLGGSTANVSGYPGDKCSGACQYYDVDPFSSLASLTVHYLTDTFNGQSGSGVYIFYNSGRYVAAAHRGTCPAVTSNANCGVRITSSRLTQIQGWINSGF